MNTPSLEPDEADPLVRAAQLRQARHSRWLREGDPSVARRLAEIGVLGWIIVVPMLLGVFAGGWLDRHFNSGLFYTAPLLMLGLGFRLLVRLEMGEGRMSPTPFSHLPHWVMAVSLASHLAAGIGLGVLYFRTLWWTTLILAEGRRTATAIALVIGRFFLLGGLLTLASLEGAPPLLAMAIGVLVGRSAVLRGLWRSAP